MTTESELLQRLGELGVRRRAVEQERSRIAAELHLVIQDAAASGWAKTRIAEVAGVSRQTVHNVVYVDRR